MKKFVIIMLLIPAGLLLAESFVVEKKTKKVSSSKLKETCCSEFGEQLKLLAQMLKEMSVVQEKELLEIAKFLEGDGFFAHVTKSELQGSLEKIKTFTADLKQMKNKLQAYKVFLRTMKKA